MKKLTSLRLPVLAAALGLGLAGCNNDTTAQNQTPPATTPAVSEPVTSSPATQPVVPPVTEPVGLCDAAPAQFAVGQPATPELVEQARVASGAAIARTIAPDQVVTMEFRADRLTLNLDAAGAVATAVCG